MGWDAFAMKNGKDLKHTSPLSEDGYQLKDSDLRKAFNDAAERVYKKAGSVDWLLERGALDCSDCANVLEDILGIDTYDENLLTNRQLVAASEGKIWCNDKKKHSDWAYYSAKEFVRVCIEKGLGIEFSF